jgi:hypothetical protein
MASTPRANIADDTILDLHCAICGEDALHVVHIDRLPDYVECSQCKSAFIMEEGGDRVLYGQIADDYPQTAQFALKQWAWIEAVDARASEERPVRAELTSEPSAPLSDEPTPTSQDEAGYPDTTEEDLPGEPWSVFDEAESVEEPAADDLPAPDLELELPEDLAPSSPTPEENEDAQDEQDLFADLADDFIADESEQPERQVTEADHEVTDEPEVEQPDEIPGFAWLGGLADEDSGLEEPDLTVPSEPSSGQTTEQEEADAESGLSGEDLDDLFRADIEEPGAQEFLAESEPVAGDELDSGEPEGWLAFDAEADEEIDDEEASAAWMEDLDFETEADEEASAGIEHDFDASTSETDDDLDWLSPEAEPTAPDDQAMFTPVEESAQHEQAEPAFSDYDLSEEGFAFDEEDVEQDFLSSLRDSAAIPLESQPLEDPRLEESDQEIEEPAPPSWALEESEQEAGVMAARMQSVTASDRVEEVVSIDDEEIDEGLDELEDESTREDVIHYRPTDPPPGFRHRVVVGGDHVVFPGGECVHCGRTPVKGQLAIAGTLPAGQGMGDRKPTRFQVPLCGECRDRATSLSEDAKSARLQSLLFALIIGMAFVVGSLAFGLVTPGDMQLIDWFILLILFIVGFAGSAILLLSRLSNYPPPLDAAYVRTTLLIPSETQGLETAFEWRNQDYAQRFYEANESDALGNVTRVKDRLDLTPSG